MENKKLKIYVAMSGGVDSSVAAALLKKQGHDVTGVFFKPWQPGPTANFCQWEQDRLDAMRVATKLGVKFKTWDFSREYGKHVARYMINGYRAGITPNPDVMCNKEIKFGLFLKKALAEEADYIATGHYARLRREIRNPKHEIRNKFKIQNPKFKKLLTAHYSLLTAKDSNKDQSYFLWTLTQEQLKHCLFPIGSYAKPEVRKLAKKFGLPNYAKKDSQGVCFVGQLDMKEFLKNYIKPKTGQIILVSDKKTRPNFSSKNLGGQVGTHDGVYYYTIGQRHGLDIKDGGGPYYVVRKDIKKNVVYVTNARQNSRLRQDFGGQANLKSAYSAETASATKAGQISKIEKVNWIAEKTKLPMNCQVKIRYRSGSIPATISKLSPEMGKLAIKFKKPTRAVTPGQSAVFYKGDEVLGGGIIE